MNRTLDLSSQTMDAYMALFGMNDQHISLIEQECNVVISLHENVLSFSGEETDTEQAVQSVRILLEMISRHEPVDRLRIRYVLSAVKDGNPGIADTELNALIAVTHRGKQIRCKTLGQMQYVNTVRSHDLTFAVGPAGTGKTYLAMALAVVALKNKEVERIILTRPAVEAGERLGFLPGDMQEKVDPYLRPLYDALYDVLGMDAAAKLREKGVIEVVPLAYMRGRTLDNAFIILDEAQNTTREQMKMFLTRMGFNSKVVVTGDITQIDLPSGTMSGLKEARKVLDGVEGIRFSYFTEIDVVRHELVKRIIKAYESYDKSNKIRTDASRGGKTGR